MGLLVRYYGKGHPQDGQIIENIVTPDPPTVPKILSATAFQDVCEAGLGSTARFGAVLRAMETSVDDAVLAVFKRYEKSITFEKTKAGQLLTLLVTKGVANFTANERLAILAAWPEG